MIEADVVGEVDVGEASIAAEDEDGGEGEVWGLFRLTMTSISCWMCDGTVRTSHSYFSGSGLLLSWKRLYGLCCWRSSGLRRPVLRNEPHSSVAGIEACFRALRRPRARHIICLNN